MSKPFVFFGVGSTDHLAIEEEMPKVKRIGPYRLHFFSADRREPPHVHIERDKKTAKFWLAPVRLANKRGFADREIRQVMALVVENEFEILRVWHERFDQ